MIFDALLFKIIKDHSVEYVPLLCIPTSKVDLLLNHYHSALGEVMHELLSAVSNIFFLQGLEHSFPSKES